MAPSRTPRRHVANPASKLALNLALAAALAAGALLPQTALAQHRFGGQWHGGQWSGGHRYGGGWGWWGYGGVLGGLPAVAPVITIGAITYWVADGQYYRAVPSGGYVLVPPPEGVDPGRMAGSDRPFNTPGPDRLYIYPRNGQSAEKQASDEYDCHKWAVGQTGFDPVSTTLGSASGPGRQGDYVRAQAACLDARGYTAR
jgi:hypothetical protein